MFSKTVNIDRNTNNVIFIVAQLHNLKLVRCIKCQLVRSLPPSTRLAHVASCECFCRQLYAYACVCVCDGEYICVLRWHCTFAHK